MEKKKPSTKTRQKKTFLTQSLKTLLTQQGLRVLDISRRSLLSQGTLSNIFAGKRLPSDEVLFEIGKGMRLNRNEIAQMFFHLARTRTIGSAREIWTELMERLQSQSYLSKGFVRSHIGGMGDDLALIPAFKKPGPDCRQGRLRGIKSAFFLIGVKRPAMVLLPFRTQMTAWL